MSDWTFIGTATVTVSLTVEADTESEARIKAEEAMSSEWTVRRR